MPIPSWSVGQVLASADVNNWFVPKAVIKPGDTGRTSITISPDPDLTLTLAASANYVIDFQIFYTGVAGGSTGLLWANWTVPAGGSFVYQVTGAATQGGGGDTGYSIIVAGVKFAAADTIPGSGGFFTSGVGTIWSVAGQGLANGGSSGGTFSFNWGQAVVSGTATTVKTNSYLVAQRIS